MVQTRWIITVILSVLTLTLLYRQYYLQRYRVKMDLFDKRFKVYSHVVKFIHTGIGGVTDLDVVKKFESDVPEYEFIFDKDGEIVKYINDILDKGLEFSHLRDEIKELNHSDCFTERDQFILKKRPYVELFDHEFNMVKYRFSKYLYLGEVEDGNFLFKLFRKIRK